MQVYYNSKHNFFRTPELWDIELLLYFHFPKKEMFVHWLDTIQLELKHGAYFVFDLSHEARILPAMLKNSPYSLEPIFLDWVIEYIEKNNLNSSAIQFWTGDLNCHQNISHKYKDIIKPKIRFNHLPIFSTDKSFLELRNFDKKFSIMMGRIDSSKSERVKLYKFLANNSILNNCYYCFNTINPNSEYPTKFLESIEERSNPDYDLPRQGEKYFKKSFCHIVMETYYDERYTLNRKFISEKIFRATNSLQPFLLFGVPNLLKDFKELGFKTFDKWWDESYDAIEDNDKRFNALSKIILELHNKPLEELQEMYIEMIPTLQWNFNQVFKINELEEYYLPIDGVFNEIGGLEYVYQDMCLEVPVGMEHQSTIPRIYHTRENKK